MQAVKAKVIPMATAIVLRLFARLASTGGSGTSSSGKQLLAGGSYGFNTGLTIWDRVCQHKDGGERTAIRTPPDQHNPCRGRAVAAVQSTHQHHRSQFKLLPICFGPRVFPCSHDSSGLLRAYRNSLRVCLISRFKRGDVSPLAGISQSCHLELLR